MEFRHTHRIFVPDKLVPDSVVAASANQAHHVLNVLRLKGGDVLRLFNGRDGEYRCSIAATGKRTLQISVHEQLRPQQSDSELWLCCAPIKKAHFDYVIEKATELGVNEIQPILTQRTQIREVNIDRAYNLCREAAEQSERLSIPAIGNPVTLDDFVDVFPKDRALIVCAEWGNAVSVYNAFSQLDLCKFSKAAIITGPEGGFAANELEKLRQTPHVFFVRLGLRILRADTAALAALVCWQAFQGDWKTKN